MLISKIETIIKKIGVIGGGTMGTGISMAALNSGFSVVMIEQDQNGLEKAFEKIAGTYDRNINLGRITIAPENWRPTPLQN